MKTPEMITMTKITMNMTNMIMTKLTMIMTTLYQEDISGPDPVPVHIADSQPLGSVLRSLRVPVQFSPLVKHVRLRLGFLGGSLVLILVILRGVIAVRGVAGVEDTLAPGVVHGGVP